MSKIADKMKELEIANNRRSAVSGAAICLNGMLARGEITEQEFYERFEKAKIDLMKGIKF